MALLLLENLHAEPAYIALDGVCRGLSTFDVSLHELPMMFESIFKFKQQKCFDHAARLFLAAKPSPHAFQTLMYLTSDMSGESRKALGGLVHVRRR
jgi:hypothetical protein